MTVMSEPYASEFRRLVRLGAGARDVHGRVPRTGYSERTSASDAFVAREVSRVDTHRQGCCALIEAFVGQAPRVLDVGCSTGGTTVALALSPVLAAEALVGVDPDALSLQAAGVRARAHGVEPARIAFRQSEPGRALPFDDDSFDLVVCVSVLEFVPTTGGRRHLVDEMKRVLRPGGHLFLSTPSPFRPRDLHGRRWLGDAIRRDGYPWASAPWTLRAMLADCTPLPTERWIAARALERARFPLRRVPGPVAWATAALGAWQKWLVRKDAPRHATPG